MSKNEELFNLLSAMGCSQFKFDSDAYGDKIICQCPMHPDSNPSFMLRPETHIFNCFACGSGPEIPLPDGRSYNPKSGLINLYKKHVINVKGKSPTTAQALKFVSKYVNLPNMKKKRVKKRSETYEVPPLPDSYLAAYFPAEGHYEYMESRGFSRSFCDKHCIGFDKIKQRVVFPIRDLNGDLVSFTGRSLMSKTRLDEVNKAREKAGKGPIPRYLIYYKAPRRFLMGNGQYTLDHSDSVIVVEASMDYLALRKYGYDNVVCIYGSHVSDYQWSLLRKFKKIYGFLDNDRAGADGVVKLIKRAEAEDGPKILIPQYTPEDRDFDEMPPSRVHELVETAKSYKALTKKKIPKIL